MLIGEVSRHSGVSVRMLRHYDRLGLVRPATRTAGGYRDYSPDDIARLFRVVGLRALGVPLAGIKTLLDTPGTAEPADMVDELIAQTRQRISRETELLTLLTRIADAAPTDWEDVLNSVKLLHDLDSDSAAQRQRAALTARDGRLSPEALAKAVLAETDTNVAGTLVWALASAADPAAEAALGSGLDSADPEIRRRAVSAIAAMLALGLASSAANWASTSVTSRTSCESAVALTGRLCGSSTRKRTSVPERASQSRKSSRPSVPSWDDIMFGGRGPKK